MKTCVALIVPALVLCGCATAPPPAPQCPAGQEPVRMAQIFFGRDAAGVTEKDFARFVDEVITPRFPDGLTVMDGGGQWRNQEDVLIREASKVVLIVLPKQGANRKLAQVREAYRRQFSKDTVLVTQASCVAF